jgi:hypothetical protein
MVLLLALSGCAPALSPSDFEGSTPRMRPEIFFAGSTRSTGVLENGAGAPTRRLQVEGQGHEQADGSFRLDQAVTFDHDPPRLRTWVLHRVDDHRYVGTLTEATGPVECESFGNLLRIRYAMTAPIGGRMEQWLYLQPDGATVVNEATVRVLGVVVAHLSERITRDAP